MNKNHVAAFSEQMKMLGTLKKKRKNLKKNKNIKNGSIQLKLCNSRLGSPDSSKLFFEDYTLLGQNLHCSCYSVSAHSV